MEYNKIYNPEKNKWFSLFSKEGRNTLKTYLKKIVQHKNDEKIGGWGPPPSRDNDKDEYSIH